MLIVTIKNLHYDTLITSYKYNKNKNLINQKIEEIRIDKKFEEHSWHGNLDSAFVHRNDKEIPRYDTSIISYKYDKKGNPINQLYINSRGEIGETVTTLYSGKQKTLTLALRRRETLSLKLPMQKMEIYEL